MTLRYQPWHCYYCRARYKRRHLLLTWVTLGNGRKVQRRINVGEECNCRGIADALNRYLYRPLRVVRGGRHVRAI